MLRREFGSCRCFGRGRLSTTAGMTLLELIISCSLLLILSSMALPIFRYAVIREKESELRYDLRTMKDAIDRYKELADEHKFRTEIASDNYPPDLDTLVKGVKLGTGNDKTLRFLRKVPIDPMTGKADWGLRSSSDDPDSTVWGGKNVFDVYSRSMGTALDGSKYSDW
jgi:general secretion pathway protein G